MVIHNSLTFTILNIDNYYLDQDFEVCSVHLNPVYDKLSISGINISFLGNFSTFLTNFDLILHKFLNLKFNLIICGDININYLAESYKRTNSTIFCNVLISVALSIFLLEKDKIHF
jgi:hypothetical protein